MAFSLEFILEAQSQGLVQGFAAGKGAIGQFTADSGRYFKQLRKESGQTFQELSRLPGFAEHFDAASGRFRNASGKFVSGFKVLREAGIGVTESYQDQLEQLAALQVRYQNNIPVLNQLIAIQAQIKEELREVTGAGYDAAAGLQVITEGERLLRKEGILTEKVIASQRAKFRLMEEAAAGSAEELLQVAKAEAEFEESVRRAVSQQDELSNAGIRSTAALKEEFDELQRLSQAHAEDEIATRQLAAAKANLATEVRDLTGADSFLEQEIRSTISAQEELAAANIRTGEAIDKDVAKFQNLARLAAKAGDAVAFGNAVRELERLGNEQNFAIATANKQAEAMDALSESAEGVAIDFSKINTSAAFGHDSLQDVQRFAKSVKTSNFALQNFSFIVQDSAQFMVGGRINLAQGLRAVANNMDATLYSVTQMYEAQKLLNPELAKAGKETELWKQTLLTLGRSLKSPLGAVVALNIVTSSAQVLSQILNRGKEEVKDYENAFIGVLKPIDQFYEFTIQSASGVEGFLGSLEKQREVVEEIQNQLEVPLRFEEGRSLGDFLLRGFDVDVNPKFTQSVEETVRVLKEATRLLPGADSLFQRYETGVITLSELQKALQDDAKTLKEALDGEEDSLEASAAAARAKEAQMELLRLVMTDTQLAAYALEGALQQLENQYIQTAASAAVFAEGTGFEYKAALEGFRQLSQQAQELETRLAQRESTLGKLLTERGPTGEFLPDLPELPDEIKALLDGSAFDATLGQYLNFVDRAVEATLRIADAQDKADVSLQKRLVRQEALSLLYEQDADLFTQLQQTRAILNDEFLQSGVKANAQLEQRLESEGILISLLQKKAELEERDIIAQKEQRTQQEELLELEKQLVEARTRSGKQVAPGQRPDGPPRLRPDDFTVKTGLEESAEAAGELDGALSGAASSIERIRAATPVKLGFDDIPTGLLAEFERGVKEVEIAIENTIQQVEQVRGQETAAGQLEVEEQRLAIAKANLETTKAARTDLSGSVGLAQQQQEAAESRQAAVEAEGKLVSNQVAIEFWNLQKEAADRTRVAAALAILLANAPSVFGRIGEIELAEAVVDKGIELVKLRAQNAVKGELRRLAVLEQETEIEKVKQNTFKLLAKRPLQKELAIEKLRESNAQLELDILSLQAVEEEPDLEQESFRLQAEKTILGGRAANRQLLSKETAELEVQEDLLRTMLSTEGEMLGRVRARSREVERQLELVSLYQTTLGDIISEVTDEVRLQRARNRILEDTVTAYRTVQHIGSGLQRTNAVLLAQEGVRAIILNLQLETLREQEVTIGQIAMLLSAEAGLDAALLEQDRKRAEVILGIADGLRDIPTFDRETGLAGMFDPQEARDSALALAVQAEQVRRLTDAATQYENVISGAASFEEAQRVFFDLFGGEDPALAEQRQQIIQDQLEASKARIEELPRTTAEAWAETAGEQRSAIRDMGISTSEFFFSTEEGMKTMSAISQNAFGAIASFAEVAFNKSDKANKKWFRLMKAAKVAQAIIDTYTAANAAAAQSGIFAPAVVPAIIAMGLANVAKIIATEPGSTSGGGGSEGSIGPLVDRFGIIDASNFGPRARENQFGPRDTPRSFAVEADPVPVTLIPSALNIPSQEIAVSGMVSIASESAALSPVQMSIAELPEFDPINVSVSVPEFSTLQLEAAAISLPTLDPIVVQTTEPPALEPREMPIQFGRPPEIGPLSLDQSLDFSSILAASEGIDRSLSGFEPQVVASVEPIMPADRIDFGEIQPVDIRVSVEVTGETRAEGSSLVTVIEREVTSQVNAGILDPLGIRR